MEVQRYSTILITICARGGSKGIPGKNIKMLNGKPLIGYTIDTARKFAEKHLLTDIVLSTDSEQIREVAASCGLVCDYVRPDYLAEDTSGKIDAIADVLGYAEKKNQRSYDYILDLDVTSPLRTVEDLSAAFEMLLMQGEAINLFSVSPASRNPYFNMVEQKSNGFFDKVKTIGDVSTRQSAPRVYDLNASFYFYKREFFTHGYKGAITDRSLIYEVPHVCFDLDYPLDFEILEFLLRNNKLDFQL